MEFFAGAHQVTFSPNLDLGGVCWVLAIGKDGRELVCNY